MTHTRAQSLPRNAVIDALAYPRRVLHGSLNVDECPHSGFYSPGDVGCQDCDDRPECQWLYHNDEFVSLDRKSDEDLVQALDFAICYITAQIAGHNARSCHCDSCEWLRGAQQLYELSRIAS